MHDLVSAWGAIAAKIANAVKEKLSTQLAETAARFNVSARGRQGKQLPIAQVASQLFSGGDAKQQDLWGQFLKRETRPTNAVTPRQLMQSETSANNGGGRSSIAAASPPTANSGSPPPSSTIRQFFQWMGTGRAETDRQQDGQKRWNRSFVTSANGSAKHGGFARIARLEHKGHARLSAASLWTADVEHTQRSNLQPLGAMWANASNNLQAGGRVSENNAFDEARPRFQNEGFGRWDESTNQNGQRAMTRAIQDDRKQTTHIRDQTLAQNLTGWVDAIGWDDVDKKIGRARLNAMPKKPLPKF